MDELENEELEYRPGDGYESKPPKPEMLSSGLVTSGGPVKLNPDQFHAYQAERVPDPDDKVGARCFHAGGPQGLPCVRRRGHDERGDKAHRSFAGEDPKKRVFYEW